jgi:2,4-dienoyl-CoA reductase-like NADH-dependent reductase (Old Yellow Enzyme family)
MSKPQDPIVIRGNTIKNRIVMEPMRTFSFHGDNGSFYGTAHIEHYTARAKGGAGLIIVEATPVSGASNRTQMWKDADTKALGQLAAKPTSTR